VHETGTIRGKPEPVIAIDQSRPAGIKPLDDLAEGHLKFRLNELFQVRKTELALMDQAVHGIELFERLRQVPPGQS